MRRALLSVVVLLAADSAIQAQQPAKPGYLFMQYSMNFRRNPDGTTSAVNQNIPPTSPSTGGGGTTTSEPEIITLRVNAVVEVKTYTENLVGSMQGPRVKAQISHKFGKSSLYNDEQLETRFVPMNGVHDLYHKVQLPKLRKEYKFDKHYDLCDWCLAHGLLPEFISLMDEVAKSGKKTGLDKLDKAIECYTQVKEQLAKRLDREDHANAWRAKLGFRKSESDHYSMLYNTQNTDPPEVQRRLDLLEENMKAVYYWFALHGVALPMPDQKLVTVLLDQPDQFILQRTLVEEEPLVADSFFSTRDNVAVFSHQRLDVASQQFSQYQAYINQGWDEEQLLQGKGSRVSAGKTIDEQFKMQTLALLNRALRDQGERAAVTHDGTRQLFVACGIQKNTVILPDWMQFGISSVFETAKGPYQLAPVINKVPYWYGWGGESWEYARILKAIEQGGMMHEIPDVFLQRGAVSQASAKLRAVVTDALSARARDLGPFAGGRDLIIARAYAWGLSYFLCKDRPAGVMRLFEELNKMPRDLELEPTELLACFCRAFDIANDTKTGPDPQKFEEFAKNWLGFLRTIGTPGPQVEVNVSNPGGGAGGPGAGGGKGKGNPKGKG